MTALLTRLRQLEASATPGPWDIEEGHIQRDSGGIRYWQISDGQDAVCCNQFCYAANELANAALITTLRNHLPEIIAALEKADG